jgi:hypothetical protein
MKKLSGKEKRQARKDAIGTTIEKLEGDYWGDEASYPSGLVEAIYRLRKKKLGDFTPEDLRIVIGQNQSLPILMPMAIEVLKDNILAEGDFYPGDLLQNVLTVKSFFWIEYPHLLQSLTDVFEENRKILESTEEISAKEKSRIFELFEHFLAGNIQ